MGAKFGFRGETAKAFCLAVSQPLLLRADKVIE